jgi:hypothetical protein
VQEEQKKPHPAIKFLFFLLLLTFFGGGAVLFANLFGHFLSESAFAIFALVIMAELAILFVAGVIVRVTAAHRAFRSAAEKSSDSN